MSDFLKIYMPTGLWLIVNWLNGMCSLPQRIMNRTQRDMDHGLFLFLNMNLYIRLQVNRCPWYDVIDLNSSVLVGLIWFWFSLLRFWLCFTLCKEIHWNAGSNFVSQLSGSFLSSGDKASVEMMNWCIGKKVASKGRKRHL